MSMNSDLLLDVSTHDLTITGYNISLSEGMTATAQRIKIRLRLFLREWFLDQTAGIPYYDSILVKNPDLVLIDSLIRSAILTTPTITELITFNFEYDPRARKLFIDFVARMNSGDLVESDLILQA